MPLSLDARWLAKHPRKTQSDIDAARLEGMQIVEFHGDVIMVCADDAKFVATVAKSRKLPKRKRALLVPDVGWIEIPPRQAVKTVARRQESRAPYPMKDGVPPPGYEVFMKSDGKIVRI